jgi:hypothetical protein
MEHSTPDPFEGTPLGGIDTTAISELSADCCGLNARLYVVQPVVEWNGVRSLGKGVPFKSCCVGAVVRDAYLNWLPHLANTVAFLTSEVTDDAP